MSGTKTDSARPTSSGPDVSRWDRISLHLDRLGHFAVGATIGFLGGLMTGRILVAAIIGVAVGVVYLLLRMRFGDRLDTGLELTPEQVAARAHSRANGYLGPGLG